MNIRSIALRSVLTNDTLAVHILMSTGASLRDTKGQKFTHEASTWNAVPAASILSSTKYFSSWMAQQKVFWFIPSSRAHQAAARRSRKSINYRHEGWSQRRNNSDPDRLGKMQLQWIECSEHSFLFAAALCFSKIRLEILAAGLLRCC